MRQNAAESRIRLSVLWLRRWANLEKGALDETLWIDGPILGVGSALLAVAAMCPGGGRARLDDLSGKCVARWLCTGSDRSIRPFRALAEILWFAQPGYRRRWDGIPI